MATLGTILKIIWASPWTLLGLTVGLLGVSTGGRVHRVGRVIEFCGGVLPWLLERFPLQGGAAAMTLGHTVLGCSKSDLDETRDHELIHVNQYERWGILFVPAYLLASLFAWLRGGDAYRDNPFERQAFDEGG